VVISHAHLDHSSWLPALVKHGYRDAIHASPATCALARVLLLDSAHLQEEDARRANCQGFSRHAKAASTRAPFRARAGPDGAAQTRPRSPDRPPPAAPVTVGHLLGACAVHHRTRIKGCNWSSRATGTATASHATAQPIKQADVLIVEAPTEPRPP
jgi:metallo-beta-lactamase family protein